MQELQEQITDREQFNQIDLREFVPIGHIKASVSSLMQLKAIKKRRLENKQNSFIKQECIEIDICKDLENNDIDKAIEKVRLMQKQKGILSFTRMYLNNIIDQYSNMNTRTKQRRVKKILEKAISIREGRTYNKFFLVNLEVGREWVNFEDDDNLILFSFI